jgi:hypothetical protein
MFRRNTSIIKTYNLGSLECDLQEHHSEAFLSREMISSTVFSVAWWRDTIRSVARLASRFALPAAALTIANIVAVVALDRVQSALNGQDLNADLLSQSILIGIVSMFMTIALMLWSFGMWLLRLTAVARSRLVHGAISADLFEQSLQEVSPHKMYLSKIWMIASIWLLVPITPLSMLFTLRIAATSGLATDTLGLAIPAWSVGLMNVSILFLLFIGGAFSFLVLAVSSFLTLSPRKVCIEAAALGSRRIGAVAGMTLILLFFNAIASPMSVANLAAGISIEKLPLAAQIALQMWLGVCSCVLWPLSVLPFCELIPADMAR